MNLQIEVTVEGIMEEEEDGGEQMEKQDKTSEIMEQDCGREEDIQEDIMLTCIPIFIRTSTAEVQEM